MARLTLQQSLEMADKQPEFKAPPKSKRRAQRRNAFEKLTRQELSLFGMYEDDPQYVDLFDLSMTSSQLITEVDKPFEDIARDLDIEKLLYLIKKSKARANEVAKRLGYKLDKNLLKLCGDLMLLEALLLNEKKLDKKSTSLYRRTCASTTSIRAEGSI